jgi:hypothetical protein
MAYIQFGKESPAGNGIEGILQVQANQAASTNRLKASKKCIMYLSFDTGFCENIALYISQMRSDRFRYPCDGVAMSHPR